VSVLFLNVEELDQKMRRYRWFLPVGLLLFFGQSYLPFGIGFFLGAMVGMTGALCAAASEWRSDRGLWMAAVVCLVLIAPFWFFFLATSLADIRWNFLDSVWLGLSVSLSTSLTWSAVRICATVIRENWRISRIAERPLPGERLSPPGA